MINPYSLAGKTILVTGASSGIGRAIAIESSRLGARLFITGRNKERLNQTFNDLYGGNHIQIQADLYKSEEMENLVNQISVLDGFVSNAGISKPLLLKISEKEDVREALELNTFIPIFLTQLLIKNNKLNRKTSLVYISSISGVNCGLIGGSLYGASKAALGGFTKGLALELANREIRVNTVNPGMISTPLLSASSFSEDLLQEDVKKYPLKRYGKPEDVAYAVIFLLSDAASWITGSNLLIDGGYTLQ